MDTACNLPFEAYLIVNPEASYSKKVQLGFMNDISNGANHEIITAEIEENDELDLYFDSSDLNARLYLDALECCPITPRIHVDDDGSVYCTPGKDIIKLYRSDSNYDALRVDTLQMSVLCDGNVF
jgi:hypothetical protein